MIAVATTLAGRREAMLLDLPSVRRMAETLAARCREPSWVRTSVASLDRFRAALDGDLAELLAAGRGDVAVAEGALQRFRQSLVGHSESQIAALLIGPQLWFRLNGVMTSWRTTASAPPPLPTAVGHSLDRLVLLSLIGSGLHLAELLRLRLGDVGSLAEDGSLIPDTEAEPLAVRYSSLRGQPREYITFLSFGARTALRADLDRRAAAGQPLDGDAPLIARPDGRAATTSTVAYARRRNSALIRVGNEVNVAMCKATGDFFRSWGMPGARFVEPVDCN